MIEALSSRFCDLPGVGDAGEKKNLDQILNMN